MTAQDSARQTALAARSTPPNLLIGKPFETALAAPLSLTSQNQTARITLQKLSDARHVSILLDRRVDPGQVVSVQTLDTPLLDVLTTIASQLKAVDGTPVALVTVGHTVLLGPETSTTRLRTVLELLRGPGSAEVSTNSTSAAGTAARRTDRRTLSWEDLEAPATLLDRIETAFKLRLTDRHRLPADLWAAGSIPSATADQTLLLVLSQFDLSIEWSRDSSSARLVPLPPAPTLTRSFSLQTGSDADKLLAEIQTRFPASQPSLTGRRLTASGRLEELEAIERQLNPTLTGTVSGNTPGNKSENPRPSRPAPGVRPGREKTYTFEIRNASLDAFMVRLSEQAGFQFEYDPEELKAAGIRLDVVLELKMKDAPADKLLHAMFDDHRIGFVRTGMVVQLKPLTK